MAIAGHPWPIILASALETWAGVVGLRTPLLIAGRLGAYHPAPSAHPLAWHRSILVVLVSWPLAGQGLTCLPDLPVSTLAVHTATCDFDAVWACSVLHVLWTRCGCQRDGQLLTAQCRGYTLTVLHSHVMAKPKWRASGHLHLRTTLVGETALVWYTIHAPVK